MGKAVLGIDVGGSATKIVGFYETASGKKLISPQLVQANDPLTSIYGAFGKFTMENGLSLQDIDRVMMTGVGSTFAEKPLYEGLDCRVVSEFECVGTGGLYLSGLDEAIVVSMGTGTALIHAKKLPNGKIEANYLGGTGVGGGTLMGLSHLLLGVDTIEHIAAMCEDGDISNIDLRISDMTKKKLHPGMNRDLTAANFGKLNDMASKNDIALGIANMVGETIGMLTVFAARSCGIDRVVLTGNLTNLPAIRNVFPILEKTFPIHYIVPENARYGTVIGAALIEEN